MENRKYIIFLSIFICICFIFVGYCNYEKIINFFDSKEWEFVESFATLRLENITQVDTGKLLLVLNNNELKLYKDNIKSEYSENIITTDLLVNSCDNYMAVVIKDTNTIYLFRESELMWKKEFNWEVMNISVNKNGYIAIVYSQSGYKSSIKILKPNGDELFTSYLASTYALDVEISNDNKFLYIAEIDTEGIKIKSNIKIIEIANVGQENNNSTKVRSLLVGNDELITDIEYGNTNQLYVLKSSGIAMIDSENQIKTIETYDPKNTLFASISNLKYPILIEKVSTGIFTNETNLKIYKEEEILEINIEKTPQNMDVMGNKIALNLGDEVLFLNTNGKVEKRCKLEKQLISVKLYDNGNKAALIFRDRIELLKI